MGVRGGGVGGVGVNSSLEGSLLSWLGLLESSSKANSGCADKLLYVWINLWSGRTCRANSKQKLRSPVSAQSGFLIPSLPPSAFLHTLSCSILLFCKILLLPLFVT